MKKLLLTFVLGVILVSCTENEKAKGYGGTATVHLPAGKKLMNVTWKETDIWYLTRDMKANDSAETYEFKEKSNYGVWEGTYIIIESK